MPSLLQRVTPHDPSEPTVAFDGVSISYGSNPALESVSFELHPGEQVAVVGPNGAGKSTLFRAMAGEIRPDRGAVRIYGSGPDGHICIGYVPQRSAIDWRFPVTVRDVVMMGRTGRIGFFRWPGKQDRELVDQAMEIVQVTHLAERQIGELSGGQQQRVFLARALAQEAELLLLDEPLSGLDVTSQRRILGILEALHERGITIVVATHDLNQAQELFERVLLINRRLVADGTPDEVLTAPLLAEAYGSHLHVIVGDGQTTILTDTCCEGHEHGYEPYLDGLR